jgi:hypothetical protein
MLLVPTRVSLACKGGCGEIDIDSNSNNSSRSSNPTVVKEYLPDMLGVRPHAAGQPMQLTGNVRKANT